MTDHGSRSNPRFERDPSLSEGTHWSEKQCESNCLTLGRQRIPVSSMQSVLTQAKPSSRPRLGDGHGLPPVWSDAFVFILMNTWSQFHIEFAENHPDIHPSEYRVTRTRPTASRSPSASWHQPDRLRQARRRCGAHGQRHRIWQRQPDSRGLAQGARSTRARTFGEASGGSPCD